MSLYPLKFIPRRLEKIWGGRKIAEHLGRGSAADAAIGESWEIYDFPPGHIDASGEWTSSVVAEGPLAGRTLHDLIAEYGPALMGDAKLTPAGQFPLLVKYLDARENLSIQVHPDARYAASHPEAHVKNEVWYILHAEPGAILYKGLRPGVTRESFLDAIARNAPEEVIQRIAAKKDACHLLPSGTVHALGEGLLVAEIQSVSDTTFRIHDFGRIEATTGKPRKLHLEEALEVIDFSSPPPARQPRSHVAGYFTTVTRLAATQDFILEKVRFTEGVEEPVPYDMPVVWMILQGAAQVRVKGIDAPIDLARGDTVLLPARMEQPILKTLVDCVWLEATIPTKAIV